MTRPRIDSNEAKELSDVRNPITFLAGAAVIPLTVVACGGGCGAQRPVR